jgi:hypothetical protein
MVNPYKKSTDLATDTDISPNSKIIKEEEIVNASNKNQFARGLANLPDSRAANDNQNQAAVPPVEPESFNNAL